MKNVGTKVAGLRILHSEGSGLIFDPASGRILVSNAVGLAIVADLQSGSTLQEIRGKLVAGYGMPEETVEKDILDFISQLRRNKMIRD